MNAGYYKLTRYAGMKCHNDLSLFFQRKLVKWSYTAARVVGGLYDAQKDGFYITFGRKKYRVVKNDFRTRIAIRHEGETPSTLKLENCHWAKVLNRGVAKKIIESELCPDDHKCSDRTIIRRFHSRQDIRSISGVKERRLVVDDEIVGSVYGRLQCIGLERSYTNQNKLETKCLMNCLVCGHKFKRRLAAVRKGSHRCLKCQHSAEQSKGQSFNSATCVWSELHFVTERDMLYIDDARQFISAFTMNNARPEYIEAWADVMILGKGDELDV